MLRLQLCLLFLFGLVSAIAIPNHQTRSVQNSTANYFMADPATWYTISRTIGDTTTALTSFQPGSEEDATILLQPSTSMTADVSMLVKFQLYPVTAEPNGTYIIRAETHVGRYMSSTFPSTNDMSECTELGWNCTIGVGLYEVIDLSALWTFSEEVNGTNTYSITNQRNGSAYYLDSWPDDEWLIMTDNTTTLGRVSASQRFEIKPVGPVEDMGWLMIDASSLTFPGANETVPNATTLAGEVYPMTLPVALPPEAFSSPLHNRIFSSLIAVGVVGCFCIFAVVSWFSMERRRRQQQKRVAAISEVASSPTIAEMVEQGLVLQGISGRTGGRDSVVKWEAEHGEYK